MKNIKISIQLVILTIISLTSLLTITLISTRNMDNLNKKTTEITKNWLPSVIIAEELNSNISQFRNQELIHVISTDDAAMKECKDNMDKFVGLIKTLFSQYRMLLTDTEDTALVDTAETNWNTYLNLHNEVLEYSESKRNQEALDLLFGNSLKYYTAASDAFSGLVVYNKSGADKASEESNYVYSNSYKTLIAILIVIAVITIILNILIIFSITKPVHILDRVARKIADGQLDESINYEAKSELGKLAANFNKTVLRLKSYVNYINEISSVLDEIAAGNLEFQLTYDYIGEFSKIKLALNNISDSLNMTLGEINQSSEQVDAGSDQVASGAQLLAQGATEQASSIQELAATVNTISENITENAKNANDASEQASALGGSIQECNNYMQEMVSSMAEIKSTSDQIRKIIKLIDDISFQTNILSLNAAVEAARAGSAGKGFAVVANEVRDLAIKSTEAANKTTELIENSIFVVHQGTRIADKTALILNTVVEDTKIVIDTIDMISISSNNQAEAVLQVTEGINQISDVIQTNSATAEQSAAASQELSSQSKILKSMVDRFHLKGYPSKKYDNFEPHKIQLNPQSRNVLPMITDKY